MTGVQTERLQTLLYGDAGRQRRFTQDSPLSPEVWVAYGREPRARIDLLLTPHAPARAATLAVELRTCLEAQKAEDPGAPRLAYTNSYVAAGLTFEELITCALPLSAWWRTVIQGGASAPATGDPEQLAWFTRLVDAITAGSSEADARDEPAGLSSVPGLVTRATPLSSAQAPLLWRVSRNRPARPALWRSTATVKADAARRLFEPSCRHLQWAIIDSGVDARHPAGRRRNRDGPVVGGPFDPPPEAGQGGGTVTRIHATLDFSRVREEMAVALGVTDGDGGDPEPPPPGRSSGAAELRRRLRSGQAVDWDLVATQLRVTHTEADYIAPTHEHGTHVAGILAADWRTGERGGPEGPDIEVLDLRVLDADGAGEEFAILGALQCVRHLNARSEQRVIHGVNPSFSIDHDVENYACGRTPVSEEVERLIGSGVVVVAAAGNKGWGRFFDAGGSPYDGYRALSITDPGNAAGEITVGATHAGQPHSYGVSYFSSRGPTGDGRAKPDLVAPGEKITGPVPGGGQQRMDGTSMAAPHVSGAAALLMARHEELLGQPAAIKRVLMDTATDLGRERHFQGARRLDVLRAMQER